MSRVSRGLKYTWWIVKAIFVLLVMLVCGFMVWRVFFSESTPKSMESLYIDSKIVDSYEKSDGEPYLFRQEQNSITRWEKNKGYFSIIKSVFVPDANEAQIVFRYNNSTIKALQKDYNLEEVPGREENLYDVTLFLSIDLTPDNKEDNDKLSESGTRTVRCHGKMVEGQEKGLYNYRKFVFDFDSCNEDIKELVNSETLLAVYADIYYVGDTDYSEKPYGALCLYDYKTKIEKVELTSYEKKLIEAWKAEN